MDAIFCTRHAGAVLTLTIRKNLNYMRRTTLSICLLVTSCVLGGCVVKMGPVDTVPRPAPSHNAPPQRTYRFVTPDYICEPPETPFSLFGRGNGLQRLVLMMRYGYPLPLSRKAPPTYWNPRAVIGRILSESKSIIPMLYTGGFTSLDDSAGFRSEFKDPYSESSNQTGHFLTAVAHGLEGVGLVETYLKMDNKSSTLKTREVAMRLDIGHELRADPTPIEALNCVATTTFCPFLEQYKKTTSTDVKTFEKALKNLSSDPDATLELARLKKDLAPIIAKIPVNSSGNSEQDLLLTAIGWKFADIIAANGFKNSSQAADWLNNNLASSPQTNSSVQGTMNVQQQAKINDLNMACPEGWRDIKQNRSGQDLQCVDFGVGPNDYYPFDLSDLGRLSILDARLGSSGVSMSNCLSMVAASHEDAMCAHFGDGYNDYYPIRKVFDVLRLGSSGVTLNECLSMVAESHSDFLCAHHGISADDYYPTREQDNVRIGSAGATLSECLSMVAESHGGLLCAHYGANANDYYPTRTSDATYFGTSGVGLNNCLSIVAESRDGLLCAHYGASSNDYYPTKAVGSDHFGTAGATLEDCSRMRATSHEGLLCARYGASDSDYYPTRMSDGVRMGSSGASLGDCWNMIADSQEDILCARYGDGDSDYYPTRMSDGARIGSSGDNLFNCWRIVDGYKDNTLCAHFGSGSDDYYPTAKSDGVRRLSTGASLYDCVAKHGKQRARLFSR
jgi:hypothetical protein